VFSGVCKSVSTHQTCDPPGEMPRAERRSENECRVSENIKDSRFVRMESCLPGVSNAVGEDV
jgi:hypothetical protein